MRYEIKHGSKIDVLTPEEAQAMFAEARQRNELVSRVRATAIVALDANGNGQDEVYTVPTGSEFEARRVTFDLDSATDPSTGNVALNVAGRSVEILRSGTRIEYAVPSSPNLTPQIPGVQTWGSEQGPYLRNAEIFEVRVRGLTANSRLSVICEGILRRVAREPK